MKHGKETTRLGYRAVCPHSYSIELLAKIATPCSKTGHAG